VFAVCAFVIVRLLDGDTYGCLHYQVPTVSNDILSPPVRPGPMSVREAAEFASEALDVEIRPPCPSFHDDLVVHDLTLQGVTPDTDSLPESAVCFFAHRRPDPGLGDIPPTFAQLVVYADAVKVEDETFELFDLGGGETAAFQGYEFRDVPLVSGPADRELRFFVVHSSGRTMTFFVSSPAGGLPAETEIHTFLRAVSGN
jgi:hypothetical protein